jgi:hypothetical protein
MSKLALDFRIDLGAPVREWRRWRERRRAEKWLVDIARRRRNLVQVKMRGDLFDVQAVKEFVRAHTELLDREEENVRLLLQKERDH